LNLSARIATIKNTKKKAKRITDSTRKAKSFSLNINLSIACVALKQKINKKKKKKKYVSKKPHSAAG